MKKFILLYLSRGTIRSSDYEHLRRWMDYGWSLGISVKAYSHLICHSYGLIFFIIQLQQSTSTILFFNPALDPVHFIH